VAIEGRGLRAFSPLVYRNHPFRVASRIDGTEVPIVAGDQPVVDHYLGYLRDSAAEVAAAVSTLATPGLLPAVVHCAAGKDRTGVTIALALSVAGVGDHDIAREYAAEPANITKVMDRLRGMPSYGPAIDRMPAEANITPPEYMLRFLEQVREQHDGPRAWLIRQGVDEAALDRLRDSLTQPTGP
jgi:hypothetical protein